MLPQIETAAGVNFIKGRPPYPKEAIKLLRNALGIISGKTILDLGAGTGKLTECFLEANIQLIAIEPQEDMRQIFSTLFPGVPLLQGSAESIPLQDNSIDAVLVGSAFHYFDGPKALAEIARVLKSKGGLGLIWNVFDDNIDWVKKIYEIRSRVCGSPLELNCGGREWETAFDLNPRQFSPLKHRTISFSYLGKPQRVIERMLSSSIIAPLPEEKKGTLVQEICQSLNISCTDAFDKDLLIPYRTELYWAYKL